jgi:putative membrane protein
MRRAFAVLVPAAVVAVGALVTQAFARTASTPALDEPAVVAIFDLANTADIETGRLAAERAESKEVRDFGRMLAETHTAVRQQGRDLAKKLGVTPALPKDDKMADGHAAVMKKLGALRGAEFDRAFLQHEQAFHIAVLDAVKTSLLPAISNKELKDFVTSLAPAFDAHRQMAEHLEKKLGGG